MLVALTRPTGPELADCELTHIDRVPIDIDRAIAQHEAYVDVLRSLGVTVEELPRLPAHPDAVFVEDVALVLPEVAIVLRPGATSRLGEMPSMADALARFRTVEWLPAPATLDGGDVLVVGKTIVVGETTRSNEAGAEALRSIVAPHDYAVHTAPVTEVLHLKSAASPLSDAALVVNPACVDLSFLGLELIAVDPDEPRAANVLRVGDVVLTDAMADRTRAILEARGEHVLPVEIDEFAKAEAAITCKSVIFEWDVGAE